MPSQPRHVNREPPPAGRRAVLERLRARLARLEAFERGDGRAMALGLPGIDGALGGGLARGCLHELCGAPGAHGVALGVALGAALGFAAALLGRLMADGGHVAWIGARIGAGNELFGPGLAELGLAPERLIVIRARARAARLWALEEALRSPGLVAALAEVDQLSLTQSRRLQLAAEAQGVTALLLRPPPAAAAPSAAATRWQIAAAPSAQAGWQASGLPEWLISLVRCRGGRTGSWRIAWHGNGSGNGGPGNGGLGWHEVPDPLALAAGAGDRPAAAPRPARRRRA